MKLAAHRGVIVDQCHHPTISLRRRLGPWNENWLLTEMRGAGKICLELPCLYVQMRQGIVRWETTSHHWRNLPHVGPEAEVHEEEENMAVVAHGKSVVDSWKLTVLTEKCFAWHEVQIVGSRIDGEAVHVR